MPTAPANVKLDQVLAEDMDWQGAAQAHGDTRKLRNERDSLGTVWIPADRLWGAQTQRALEHFCAGGPRFVFGRPVIRALGIVKKCAAMANAELGQLPAYKHALIVDAAQEVIDGRWDGEFPLGVFQSGSGTQTNMNANEVIANRAIRLAGGVIGSKQPIHPNDDVNRSQSSNDVFPTAMHIAVVEQFEHVLAPSVGALCHTLDMKAHAYMDIVMVGRTHLQDATPITLGQVICGWVAQIERGVSGIRATLPQLYALAIGGTAVGTGLNAPREFGELVAEKIADETAQPFVAASNKVALISAHDAIVNFSGALRTLAGALFKIANDVRWYASGPRSGIGELCLPANEPGSSIMPGKSNPTQCEALAQAAVQVFGNDHAVAFAGSQGNFQLNAYKPVILYNVLTSIAVLSDAVRGFDQHCAMGLAPDRARIKEHLDAGLMLVTALTPHIGYDKAAEIALTAQYDGTSILDAGLKLGLLTRAQFEQWVRPEQMTHPT